MKKIIIIILVILLVLIAAGACAFGTWSYRNLNWYKEYDKKLKKLGAVEKQFTLPDGSVINYGEIRNDKPALLLIHGQMAEWESYAPVLTSLSEKWHIYAVDVYGHGQSSHNPDLYYLDRNGDDLIRFINEVIGERTVVAGHSNGALTAAYIAAYGGDNIAGVLLEDPPVFSTEGEDWENSFAYLDTYRSVHEYLNSDMSECWSAFYLRRCYWGQLYMKDSMPGIANYAQKYSEKHPGEEVKIFFLPKSAMEVFHWVVDYDFRYGDRFYDLTWNNGHTHEEILRGINVPSVYLHAKENRADTGVYLCAATREQAERAVGYIGENCRLIETDTSDHMIHEVHINTYIDALNSLLP